MAKRGRPSLIPNVEAGEYVKNGRIRRANVPEISIHNINRRIFMHPGQRWVSEEYPGRSIVIVDITLDENLYPIKNYDWDFVKTRPLMEWVFEWRILNRNYFEEECLLRLGRRPNWANPPHYGVFPLQWEGTCRYRAILKVIKEKKMTSVTNNHMNVDLEVVNRGK